MERVADVPAHGESNRDPSDFALTSKNLVSCYMCRLIKSRNQLPNAQSALGSSYSHSHSVTSPSTPSCGGFGALSGAQQYMARSVAYLGNAVGLPAAPGLGLMDPDHVLHRIFAYEPPALDSLWDAVRAGKTWSGLVCMPSHLDLRGLRDAASVAATSTSPCAGQRALSAAADATAAVVPESMPWSQGLLCGGSGSGGVGGGAAADTDVVGLLLQQLQRHGSRTGSRVGGGATAATATCASAAAVAVPVGSGRGVGEGSTAVVTAAAAGCGSGDSGGGGGGGSWGFGWVSHLPSASLPSPQAPPAECNASAAGSLSPDVVATITGPPPPRATAATAGGSSGGGCNNSGSRGKPVMKLPRNVSAPTFRSVASSSRPLPSVLEAEASCGGSVCGSGSAAAVSVATLLAHRASWNADQTFPAQAGTSLSNRLAQTEYALNGSYRAMRIAASAASQGLLGQGPTTAFDGGGGGWSYGSADGLQCCSPRGLDASLADQLSGPKFVPPLVANCYMVCGGLVEEDAEGFRSVTEAVDPLHAHKVFAFAADMMPGTGQYGLYDFNVAGRMESKGVPGAVHISAATRALLGAAADGFLSTVGIPVKGKGFMLTYVYDPCGVALQRSQTVSRTGSAVPGIGREGPQVPGGEASSGTPTEAPPPLPQ
ncbi:hypothetical protein VOLCADRAFT_107824 [Volvox carteri f. nagariensis]|uniref:Guanylate cyclase domain-containing protein n=1 Tax=Volvox carteri f. nagariensis TaxID=3068 RepID=D8UGP3_VOLCA|nr:uncharacterized protein VOLCADRAFT_107824 [Volvox carteri f. nagariensis]EFJ41084.1 hypothetical protein VOLCADRAFT_107824 [Volvox carteri f. nagariensis]|eukprot:XP_002957847.1 hypothetical protein VOLCADRAFT_107824 [Volvox carteri f. nagariensis]